MLSRLTGLFPLETKELHMTTNLQRTKLGLGIAALSFGLMAPLAAQAAAHTAGEKTPAMGDKTANPAMNNDRMGSSDRMRMKDWTNDKEMLQKQLKLGESKAYYPKALTDKGFLITSINTDKPSEVEYEVVKNGSSYEVQLDFNNAGKASKVNVATNMWRTDATKAAMTGKTAPAATAYVTGNETYSDRARMKNWTGEKERIEKALTAGNDKNFYASELKKLGYQVTSVNDREKDYLEYEIVKGAETYEVQIDLDNAMGKKVDVTTNMWQSEATEKALANAKR
jgi:hypothetical protein